MENKEVYFAAEEDPKEVAAYLDKKAKYWFDSLVENNYLQKIRRSWDAYHGYYYEDSHKISFGGETGELVNFAINHYRNLARHILTMVASTRPSFQPRAVNSDHKTQVQTTLAHGLLEYYMRERRLERYLKTALEYAIVLGSGYVKMEWNSTKGELIDYLEPEPILDENGEELRNEDGDLVDENGKKLEGLHQYEGDLEFSNLSPYDVVFDSTKESSTEHDWIITRTFKNKFDVAAKFPELKEEILAIPTKEENKRYQRASLTPYDKTVDIAIYEFFHKKTEAMPEGRYMMYIDDDTVLLDTPMPYRNLPVYRISPSDILGTGYGYTDMFDLLPMQDAFNSLASTVLTNQNAFGVQNILNPRGNDISVNQLESGLNFIEYNAQAGEPKPLNLTNTPAEIFNFMQNIERLMETVSGVNSVARGNADVGNLRSGNALALVQSQALQFMSGLQQSYVQLIEDVGTGLIELLQDFAEVPRVAQISGVSNKTKMKYFKGDDLSSINRVIVDVGNALAQCLGKDTPVMMADGSIKMVQDIKIGEQVMGPDSKPRTVKNVNSGKEEMFIISSKDKNRNVKYECNKSHILSLRYCSDDNRYGVKKGDVIDISVRDYLELPERHKRLLQGFTTGVDFEEKELKVPAYILGLWLGDGTSASTGLTTMDEELFLEWSKYAYSIEMQIRERKENNKSTTYFITSGKSSGRSDRNPFMNELNAMEVINNKHIPEVYLKNSKKNRLELLAGLLDTDGSLVDETFVFTQKSKKLIDQVEYLAKSLGFKVTKKLVEREFNGKEANIYKINIGGNTHTIPTKLKRKQVKETAKQKNWNNYGIKVESIGQGTYYGFTLEEEPHFLLGDFTVTHNTTAGRSEIATNLIQMGLINSPEQYLSVLNTGKLETMTEGENNELLLIKAENERLVDGEVEVIAVDTDNHALHIREHKNVLADPDSRLDPDLLARTLAHIQEHIDALKQTDPDLLAITGQQPLAPQPPAGGAPGGPGGAMPPVDTMQQAPDLPQPAEPPMGPDGQSLLPSERPLGS